MLKFRFADITRVYIDPYRLSEETSNHTIKNKNAMYGEGYRYFIVTAVEKSPPINIIAEDEKMRAEEVDVKTLQLVDISSNVSIKLSGKGEIRFKGNKV